MKRWACRVVALHFPSMLPPSFSWALRGPLKLLARHRSPGIGHPISYCAIHPFPPMFIDSIKVYSLFRAWLQHAKGGCGTSSQNMSTPLLTHNAEKTDMLDISTRKGLQDQIQPTHFRDNGCNGQGAGAALV